MIPNSITNDCIKEDTFSFKDSQGWIQPSINHINLPFSSETIIDGMYVLTKTDKIIALEEIDRSWFFTHGWQKLESEADKDIESGNWKSFDSMDDFIADLDI